MPEKPGHRPRKVKHQSEAFLSPSLKFSFLLISIGTVACPLADTLPRCKGLLLTSGAKGKNEGKFCCESNRRQLTLLGLHPNNQFTFCGGDHHAPSTRQNRLTKPPLYSDNASTKNQAAPAPLQ